MVPLILAGGCAFNGPVRTIAPAPNNTVRVERESDGTVVMRSQEKHLVTLLARNGRFNHDTLRQPSLYVMVANGGEKEATLSVQNISVYSGDLRVKLLDPVALQERLDGEQVDGVSSFPIGMRDATQPGEVRRGHHETVGPQIQPFPALKFKVPARTIEQALQTQVLQPFDVGGGRIVLESQDIVAGLPLKVVVNVGGEKHEFLFEVDY